MITSMLAVGAKDVKTENLSWIALKMQIVVLSTTLADVYL